MADIVISEFMDEEIASQAFTGFDVIYNPQLVDDRKALLKSVTDARALIVRNRTEVNETLLNEGRKLEVIGRLGVGLDNIDLDACKSRNITVCPATGANDIAVAEYVIASAMILLRKVWFSSEPITQGTWPRNELIGSEVFNKQLGLVGFGAIARQTAQRAHALGIQTVAYDPLIDKDDPVWEYTKKVELLELIKTSDIVSLHIPLTEQTKNMLDSTTINHMRPDSVLINAARGGVLDEEAVVRALKSGQLRGAALDVFESEPLSSSRCQLFRNVPNLLLTPHIAGVTAESNVRVSQLTVRKVLENLR